MSVDDFFKSIDHLIKNPLPPQFHTHPGRAEQFIPPQQQQAIVSQTPPRPPHQPSYEFFLGSTRKMQFSYDTSIGTREYHRVHDFDISYNIQGIDYVAFDKIFLAIQHGEERFVAAALLRNQRDCLAVIPRQEMRAPTSHRGRYFIHLNFDRLNGADYGGLPLVACYRDTFTVRVITAEKTGTNFFLLVEGQQYNQPAITQRMQECPFTFNVHFVGAPSGNVMYIRNGRSHGGDFGPWAPVARGPPHVMKKRSKEPQIPVIDEYDPTRTQAGNNDVYDPASPQYM